MSGNPQITSFCGCKISEKIAIQATLPEAQLGLLGEHAGAIHRDPDSSPGAWGNEKYF